ncbi:19840_t:CDS:1 [Funneliformis geosporum]|uniref:6659_t:CDS:1 n=1 Tax=Funneliformis geosporum TaxID=1117311 RepID=A0A9W4SS16_9GLOM|nr:19840_t:CDS:1 [Funneliformis geosporum]CAI2178806.1 6659_t:CDS:1 [Funneliformis geosporum]
MSSDQTYCSSTTKATSYIYSKVMKRSSYRKLRSQTSKARTAAQRESSPFDNISERSNGSGKNQLRQSSVSPSGSQPTDVNASFISVSSIPNEDFNTVQTESNFASQQSSSDNNSEDNYSNLIINHSGSSTYSFSRSSSISLTRTNSYIGTESVYSTNSRSRASSPFVETSSDIRSEVTSTNNSRRSSVLFQSYNYEGNSSDDTCSAVIMPLETSTLEKKIIREGLESTSTNIIDNVNDNITQQALTEGEENSNNFIHRAFNRVRNTFIWNKIIEIIIVTKEWVKSTITRDNWRYIAMATLITLLLCYFVPCNMGDLKNLEFSECITKINNVIHQYNVELTDSSTTFNKDNEALFRDVVADQVKTVCAAEVQKRIPTPSYDLATREDLVVDIVRQEIRKAVEEMLYTYSQDKLNKADFALSTGGAKIIRELTSPTYEQWPTQWYRLAIAKITGHGITRGKPPITALQPETHVGQCWSFSGRQGQLAVLLSRKIYVTAITYDHVSKTVAMGTTSAPKDFEVWAFVDDDNNEKTDQKTEQEFDENIDYSTSNTLKNIPINQQGSNNLESSSSNLLHLSGKDLKLGSSPNHLLLGRYTYDINKSPIQTFEVNPNKPIPIRAIIMKVTSNWDNPLYTCLYRFRVHGIRADVNSDTE